MQITSEIGIVSRGRDVQEEGWRWLGRRVQHRLVVVEGDEEGEMKQRGKKKTEGGGGGEGREEDGER